MAAMALDVEHLTQFVAKLENAFMLQQNLDELQQTVALMQSENHEEFYDISIRNKKYGRVDVMNGPILLEKCVFIFPAFLLSTLPPLCVPTLLGSVVLTGIFAASGSHKRSRTQAGRRRSLTSDRASA